MSRNHCELALAALLLASGCDDEESSPGAGLPAVPQITGQASLLTDEDVSIGLTLSDFTVTDPDSVYPDEFTLSVEAGANYTRAGNVITPTQDYHGTLTVPVTVNDGTSDSDVFQVSVDVDPVNDPPTAAAIPDTDATAGSTFGYDASSYFGDVDAGDSLSYSASLVGGAGLPAWIAIDEDTGVLSGLPLFSDVGASSIEVRAEDSAGESSGSTFSLTVLEAVAPQLVSAQLEDVDLSGDDSAGDTIELSFSSDVELGLQPTSAAVELLLPVSEDSLGLDAGIAAGPASNQVTVTLGAGTSLRLTGSFDPARLQPGGASGLGMAVATGVVAVSSGQPAIGVIDIESSLSPGFVPAGVLNEARGYHTATRLDDGRILVVGGMRDASTLVYSSEIWDQGTWTDTTDPSLGGSQGAMPVQGSDGNAYFVGRYGHTATKLADGRVLIAGGRGFEGQFDAFGGPTLAELSSAFLFDPATNEFSPTASPIAMPRRGHFAVPLPSGQVLLAGGYNSAVYGGQGGSLPLVEIFDPAAATFTMLMPQMAFPRQEGTAHLLASGEVLFAGGHLFAVTQSNPTATLYLAPDSETYSQSAGGVVGPVLSGRMWTTSAPLPDGDFVLFGGDDGGSTLNWVTRYDAATGNFEDAGFLATERARSQATPVGNGILVVGGMDYDSSTSTIANVATGELYDPVSESTQSFPMVSDRNTFQTVAVDADQVLVIGGFSGGTTSVSGLDGTAVATCELFVLP